MTRTITMKPRIERAADGSYSVVYEDPATAAKDSADLSKRIDRLIGKSPPNISGLDALKAALGAILHLSDRLKKLEAVPHKSLADSFRGPWMPGSYERGAVVQKDGLWICLEATTSKPGEGEGWRLLIPRAR